MAFMLLDDIETVVSEIGRVLRSGGTFSAMVGTPSPVRDALSVFVAIQRSLLERTGAVIPQLGDPRTHSADGLRALLGRASGFVEPIAVRQLLLRVQQAPDRIFENLSLMYPFDLLGADSQRELEREFSSRVKPLVAADGRVGCTFGLLQVTCLRGERVRRDR
jgi:hypothetical protein